MQKWEKSELSGNGRIVLAVYVILRVLVVLVMIAQIDRGSYENVYICLLTLVLFTVPSFVQRKLRVELPDTLEIVILIFIFAAEILGEIHAYYLAIPCWDTLLHAINGFLFAAIGFSLVDILNRDRRAALSLAPAYLAVTAFCFSMTIGVLWEFLEWGFDLAFGLDMQKDTVLNAIQTVDLDPSGGNHSYALNGIRDTVVIFSDGTVCSLGLGGYLDVGLHDTMADLLVNFLGAVIFSVIGYFYGKSRGRGRIAKHFIPKAVDMDNREEP